MRTLAIALLCLIPFAAGGQTPAPQNIYAFGPSYNNLGSPEIAGTALYAHRLNNDGTYGFSVFDATPSSFKPLTVVTSVGVGVAQKAFSIGKIPIYVPVDADFAWNGQNKGWGWHGGAMGSIKFYENWHFYPGIRFGSSSVSNGSGVQPIFSLLVGWSK